MISFSRLDSAVKELEGVVSKLRTSNVYNKNLEVYKTEILDPFVSSLNVIIEAHNKLDYSQSDAYHVHRMTSILKKGLMLKMEFSELLFDRREAIESIIEETFK